ncbi:hypothetical protein [Streptomyces sp. WELS2]|uniref:hypothetical protein n=1 Tax=Streptomyces sp. WELS2 TaxID=2749435 RepID=UPI0015F02405|nr:hypothetical protein [Streptomyces sp. WELS2]
MPATSGIYAGCDDGTVYDLSSGPPPLAAYDIAAHVGTYRDTGRPPAVLRFADRRQLLHSAEELA